MKGVPYGALGIGVPVDHLPGQENEGKFISQRSLAGHSPDRALMGKVFAGRKKVMVRCVGIEADDEQIFLVLQDPADQPLLCRKNSE